MTDWKTKTMTEIVIHDPANGVFDWNGTDCPDGEFRVTIVGSYLITYFQPHEAGVKGTVQIHFGPDVQCAFTARARDLAESFAEMVARDGGAGYVLMIDEWAELGHR